MARTILSTFILSVALSLTVFGQNSDADRSAKHGDEISHESSARKVRKVGCASPMSDADFQTLKQQVKSKTSSDNKMTVAKTLTRQKCLSVKQIKALAETFLSEDERLEYSKYAWHYCFDKKNYSEVSELLEFESSKNDLAGYISVQR